MTVLVDTCIIIDALANRAPFSKDAQELLLRGATKTVSLMVSAKSLLDIHYVLKHYLNDESVVRAKMFALLQSVTAVDTSASSAVMALNSPTTDYEDATQIETALIEGVDYIVTRDRPGFSKSPVQAKTALEIISLLDKGSTV